MNRSDYNPDLELTPSKRNNFGNSDYGHNLAGVITKERELEKISKEVQKQEEKISRVSKGFDRQKAMEILVSFPSSSQIYKSPKMRSILKGALGRLTNEAKMPLDYFPKSSTSKMWNLYCKVQKELGVVSYKKIR